jgi:hypothetical protein
MLALVHSLSRSGNATVANYQIKKLSKTESEKLVSIWKSIPSVETVVKDIMGCLLICADRTSSRTSKDFIVSWERKFTLYHITNGHVSIELANHVTDSFTPSPEAPLLLVHPTYSRMPQQSYRDLQELFEKSCDELNQGGTIQYRCVWLNAPPVKICTTQPLIDINAPARKAKLF